MKKLILTFSFFSVVFSTLCRHRYPLSQCRKSASKKRGNFTVNDKTVITLSVDNEEMRNAVSFWNDLLIRLPGSHWRSLPLPFFQCDSLPA